MRLVIKVGTSLIAPGGRIDTKRMRALVDQLDFAVGDDRGTVVRLRKSLTYAVGARGGPVFS
jgi:hypothetical protein